MKARFFVFVFFLFAAFFHLKSQDVSSQTHLTTPKDTSYWKLSGITGINFSQTALVNWVAGGENSVATNFYLNGALNYAKEKWAWDNNLVLEYGVIYTDQYNWRKNADKISFSSKLGYQINKIFYYSILADFNSQFAKGYNYPNINNYLSTFMAPAYTNLALGVDYKPNANYSLFFSPVTMRTTFVMDDSLSNVPGGSFGVPQGDKIHIAIGTLLKASMKKTVMKNVDLTSSLNMFTPYDKNFGNIDVNWDVLISFKINELLTTTLNTTLRYYDGEHHVNPQGINEGPKVQFKELLGLGVAYRF